MRNLKYTRRFLDFYSCTCSFDVILCMWKHLQIGNIYRCENILSCANSKYLMGYSIWNSDPLVISVCFEHLKDLKEWMTKEEKWCETVRKRRKHHFNLTLKISRLHKPRAEREFVWLAGFSFRKFYFAFFIQGYRKSAVVISVSVYLTEIILSYQLCLASELLSIK